MAIESELKLTTPLAGLRQIQRLTWLRKLASDPAKQENLVSVYFDTDKFMLRDHGVTLRVRKMGRKWVQTIKTIPDGRDGPFDRREWEAEIADEKPNYKLAKGTALEPLLTPKLKRELRPVFETKIKRTTLPLRVGKSRIEIALDRGYIWTGSRRQPVSEIELELKAGAVADLAKLAQRLAKTLPVSYGMRAKAERGYALCADETGEPVRAPAIVLPSAASVAEAFTAIGLSCLRHLAGNETAVRQGHSEGIHQMRVGLRRLRAAISIFKDVVQGPETERIKADLKWLTAQLGPARDFDVLVKEGVVPLQKANTQKSEVALLKLDLEEWRHRGFDKAKEAVESERYRRIVLQTALWLAGGKWVRNTDPLITGRRNRQVNEYAATILDSLTKKVIMTIAKLRSLDARKRHKLRIAAKKLRYAMEFFDSLFTRKTAKAGRKTFETSLKVLQDALGTLNDIALHEKLAGEFAHPKKPGNKGPAKAFAMGLVAGHEQSEIGACMAAALDAGDHLAASPRFWR